LDGFSTDDHNWRMCASCPPSAARGGTARASFSIWMLQVSCVFLFLLSFGDQFLKVSAPIFVDRVLE
jgi:hypothetical protein